MANTARKSDTDMLALAMRQARDDVAAGRVPAQSSDTENGSAPRGGGNDGERDQVA